jgi:hypothetical protein
MIMFQAGEKVTVKGFVGEQFVFIGTSAGRRGTVLATLTRANGTQVKADINSVSRPMTANDWDAATNVVMTTATERKALLRDLRTHGYR